MRLQSVWSALFASSLCGVALLVGCESEALKATPGTVNQGGSDSGTDGLAGSTGTSGEGGQGGEGGQDSSAGAAGEAGEAGAAGSGGAVDAGPVTFKRITVSDKVSGPAYATAADLNGDGKLDLVVSQFGNVGITIPNGEVKLFTQGDNLESWTESTILAPAAGYQFPNNTTVADVDGDSDPDIILAGGFLACAAMPLNGNCGALLWLENGGSDWVVHEVVPKKSELFYHHAEWVDFDGDSIKDLVTTGEKQGLLGAPDKAVAQWFKGTNDPERFEKTPNVIGNGLGSFPAVSDIDDDGDLDVVSAEYFVANESFAWMERTTGMTFEKHVINSDSGPSILLALVPNLYGDNQLRAVGANHVNTAKTPPDKVQEGVFVFDIPADRKQLWPKVTISEGIKSRTSLITSYAAPGLFGWGDIDGDGDIDIAVAGDGDQRVFWLEQKSPGVFETHVLEEKLGQAGGLPVVDLDGDGKNEVVVTGYEDNKVYLYTRE